MRGENELERATDIGGVGWRADTRAEKGALALLLGDPAARRDRVRRGRGLADSGSGSGKGKDKGSSQADTKVSQAVVTIAPKDGADAVKTSGALKVTAAKGKLTEVKVEDTKGNPVEGKITDGGATWTPATHLAASTKYKVHAVAKDSEGRRPPRSPPSPR